MRIFLVVMALYIAALAGIDMYFFDGHYRRAALREVNHQISHFSAELRYLLTRPGTI